MIIELINVGSGHDNTKIYHLNKIIWLQENKREKCLEGRISKLS